MKYFKIFFLIIIFSCSNNHESKKLQNHQRIDLGEIESDEILEASGIASSRFNQNILWTHNDSGDLNRIFAMDINGNHVGEFFLNNVENRDWEDIAIGPGPMEDVDYIFVGDIGDNRSENDVKYIYRFAEPQVSMENQSSVINIDSIESISFQYEDGNRDAETLIVDPITKDIIIISKREESAVHVYLLPFPHDTENILTAQLIMTKDFYPNTNFNTTQRIVAGDISKDGSDILIKSYTDVFYFSRESNQSIFDALNTSGVKLPYVTEPQGEAICWDRMTSGYFTLSEEADDANQPAHLYFYPYN